jgi:hypothetical protein
VRILKQSTAYSLTVFMADSSDHITGKTGLTLTITASKAGAAFASISPTVTELASGWYKLALTTSHTDTLGDLALHVTGTGADPSDLVMQVTANILGDTLPSNVTQFGGSNGTFASGRPEVNTTHLAGTSQTARDIGASVLLSTGTGTGQLDFTSGVVKSNVTQFGGAAATTASGRPEVNTTHLSGTSQTARDIGASVLLSSGTGPGQVSLSSGAVTAGTVSDKTGYALSSLGIQAIWDALTSALTTGGSVGKRIADYLDSAVSTSAPSASSTASAVRTELATELGRLDAAVTTRLASGSYTAPPSAATNASAVRTELTTELGRIDAAVSTRLASSGYTVPPTAATNASAVRTELATELARVDAAVSSRLASGSYTSPLDAAGVRTAVGLATANLDTQLSAIDTAASAAQAAAEAIPVGADGVEANIKAVNDVALTGVGTGDDPWGPA